MLKCRSLLQFPKYISENSYLFHVYLPDWRKERNEQCSMISYLNITH